MPENSAWRVEGNILAFPQGWQRPAKTEEWAYEQCSDSLARAAFFQLVCFPWATLIDLMRMKKVDHARTSLDTLEVAPPPNTLSRATVCQHIYAMDMLDWFLSLKITDLYWPHATLAVDEIDGRVAKKTHPCEISTS